MKNEIKKAFYMGVCAAAVTKKYVESHVKAMAKKGHISEQEGEKIVKHALNNMQKDAEHMRKAASGNVKNAFKIAKPLAHEGALLAQEIAHELVKDAKIVVRGKIKQEKGKMGARVKTAKAVARKVVKTAVKAAAKKAVRTVVKKAAKAAVKKAAKKVVKRVLRRR